MDYKPFWRYRPTDEEYLLERQRLNEAKARYSAAKKAHGPISPETVNALFDLADLYEEKGHFNIGEWLLNRVNGSLPYVYPADDIRSVDMLMRCAFRTKDEAEALQLGMEAVERAKLITGADSVESGYQVHNLGTLYSNHGRRDTAVKWQMAGIGILQKNLADNDAKLLGLLRWTACRCNMNGDYAEALALYRELYRVSLRDNGPESTTTVCEMQCVAQALSGSGQHEQALLLWRECCGILLSLPGASTDAVYMALKGCCDCCMLLGNYDEALKAALKQLETQDLQSNQRPITLHRIGEIYAEMGDYESAIGYLQAAMADMPRHAARYTSRAEIEHKMAASYRMLGLEQEAADAEARAAIEEEALSDLPPILLNCLEAHRLGLPDPIRTIEAPRMQHKGDN